MNLIHFMNYLEKVGWRQSFDDPTSIKAREYQPFRTKTKESVKQNLNR